MSRIALVCWMLMSASYVLPGSAAADTLRVPSDFGTIGAALGNAAHGDTVLVAPGSYAGPANRNLDFLDRDLVLVSEGGSSATTIELGQFDSAFDLTGGQTLASRIEGFTLVGGNTAIELRDSRATLVDLAFEGAVTAVRFNNATGTDPADGILRDADFRDVVVGVSSLQSSPTVENARFEACEVALNVQGESTPTFSGVSVLRCQSESGQSAVSIDNTAAPLFVGCIFQGNLNPIDGGAVCVSRAYPTFVECVITGNRAGSGVGGAVSLELRSAASFERCTIAGNHAAWAAGGIYAEDLCFVSVSESIIWGNCAPYATNLYGRDLSAACSIVEGGWEGDDVLASDPLFCEAVDCELGPAVGGAWTLRDGSPGPAEQQPMWSADRSVWKGLHAAPRRQSDVVSDKEQLSVILFMAACL